MELIWAPLKTLRPLLQLSQEIREQLGRIATKLVSDSSKKNTKDRISGE